METFRTSQEINEVAGALAAAQGQFVVVEKNKVGKVRGQTKDGRPYEYEYKYADIADVLAAALPVISKHGLCLVQPTVIEAGSIFIRSRLIHKSGQWLESDYPVCSISGDHQKMGGALTYARRYAACSLLGIAPEEDIDAQGADAGPATKQRHDYQARRERPAPQVQVAGERPALPPRVGASSEVIPPALMFDDAESESAHAEMIAALGQVSSLDELKVWARDNRISKARLKQAHRDAVEQRFGEMQAALRARQRGPVITSNGRELHPMEAG